MLVCTGNGCGVVALDVSEVVWAPLAWPGEEMCRDGGRVAVAMALAEAEAEVAYHQPVVRVMGEGVGQDPRIKDTRSEALADEDEVDYGSSAARVGIPRGGVRGMVREHGVGDEEAEVTAELEGELAVVIWRQCGGWGLWGGRVGGGKELRV